jgi:hypothetical protein
MSELTPRIQERSFQKWILTCGSSFLIVISRDSIEKRLRQAGCSSLLWMIEGGGTFIISSAYCFASSHVNYLPLRSSIRGKGKALSGSVKS